METLCREYLEQRRNGTNIEQCRQKSTYSSSKYKVIHENTISDWSLDYECTIIIILTIKTLSRCNYYYIINCF